MERMQRILAALLAVSMLLTSFPGAAFAQGPQSAATRETALPADEELAWEDYRYTVLPDGTVSICGYTGTLDEDEEFLIADVPAQIDGKDVTQIAQEAFADQADLYAVRLPETVTFVDNAAFYQCENLKLLAFCGELPAFGGITLAEGSPSLQTVLLLQDQDTEMLSLLLRNDLGEEQAASVELKPCADREELDASWQQATAETPEENTAHTQEESGKVGKSAVQAPETVTAPEPAPLSDSVPMQQAPAQAAAVEEKSTAASVIENGSCGTYANWSFSSDGTLTISGSGSISSYITRDPPWKYYSNRITKLVLEEGITSIGEYAFYNLKALTEPVSFPQSLERIGRSAFSGCSMTGDLILPHNITTIEMQAFSGCSSLNGILSLPRNLSVLEQSAFSGCSGLTGSLELPQNLVQIGSDALRGCSGFTGELVIPDSVETIGDGAFYGMSGITSLRFGSGLVTFGGSTYSSATMGNMTALQQVTFTGTVPPTVENTALFTGCDGLERVIVPLAAYEAYASALSAFLPDQTRLVPDEETGDFVVQDGVLLAYLGSETTVEVPDGVTAIGEAAFRANGTVERVVLPDSVVTIGPRAFQNCTALTEVSASAALEQIGTEAFVGCTALTTLELPQTVRSIGASAFEGCAAWQTSLHLPALETLETRAFFGCTALSGAELGGPVAEIGDSAFQNCTGMTSLTLPQTLQRIGTSAFRDCGITGNLTIPGSATEIAENAFYNCTALNGTLTIEPGVKTIGAYAFRSCSHMTAVQLGDGITSIGNEAFRSCSSLSGDLILPDTITSLGSYAFAGCTGFTGTLHLPESLTELGTYCFNGCKGITGTLRIPDKVTYLPEGAFTSMRGLTDLIVGAGVESCYYDTKTQSANVFYDTDLSTVTLLGTYTFFSSFYRLVHPETVYVGTAQYTELLQNCSDTLYSYGIDVLLRENAGDFAVVDGELVAYTGTDSEVTVPEGVTSIGPFAFFNRDEVVSVTLPEGLTAIGQGAFYQSASLAHVALPASLTTVGEKAFYRCTALEGALVLPDNVTEVGPYAFYNCSGLTELRLPAKLQTMGMVAFAGCRNLTGTLVIPESLTVIPSSAFSGCTLLSGLDLGRSVTQIESNAFGDCSGLSGTLVLPDSLTALESSAFENCSGLTGTLTLPAGLQTLGADAFAGCSGMTGTLVVPDGVATLPQRVFAGMKGITGLQLGTGLSTVDAANEAVDGPLYGMTALVEITFMGTTPPNQKGYNNFLGSLEALRTVFVPQEGYTAYSSWLLNRLPDSARLLVIGASSDFQIEDGVLVAYLGQGGEATVPDEVTSIGEGAFKNCDTLTSVILPEGLQSIGKGAFENCTGLTKVQFPTTLREVGDRAFYGCSALQAADLPDGLTTLGNYVFYQCTSLAEAHFPAGLVEVPSFLFAGCGLTSIALPETVTIIGESAFQDCTSLSGTLTLPASLQNLKSSAFRGCTGLTGLVLPEGLTVLGSRAFYGCTGLSGELHIPETVTSIGQSAFLNCSGFTGSLVLPDKLTSLGESAFSGCSGFTGALKVPDGITVLNVGVFSDMDQITSVEFGTGLTKFASVTVDVNHPLWGMTSVTSLTFHGNTVPEWDGPYGEDMTVFTPLTSLEVVYVPGESYGAYFSQYDPGLPKDVRLEAYGAQPGEDYYIHDGVLYGYWGTDTSFEVPYGVTTIAENAFCDHKELTSVILPDSVTTIEMGAFEGCTGLTGLTLPASLEEIGSRAFYGCTGLDALSLPEGLRTVGTYAFYGCTGLKGNLTIPSSLTEIGNYAFAGCTGLDGTLTVEPAERTGLGEYAFSRCSGLTGLQLGEGLQKLDYRVFEGCSSLQGTLVLPQSLTSIGGYAFSGCEGLSGTLQLPEGLTRIDSYAFRGCSGITGELTVPDGVTSLAAGAFYGMSGVTALVLGSGLQSISTGSSKGSWPLYGMTSVTELTFLGEKVPSCNGDNPLSVLTALQTIYVPTESLEAYQAAFGTGLPAGAEFSTDIFNARVGNLSAEKIYSKTVVLRWDAHDSDQVIGYTVERNGVVVGQTQDCTFTDSGLTADTDYTYRVYGYSADGRTTGVAALVVTPREPQILDILVANGTDRVNVDNTLQIRVRDFGNLEPLDDRQTVGQLYYLDGENRVLIGTAARDEALSHPGTAVYTIHWDITDLPDAPFTVLFTLTDVDGGEASLSRTLTLDHGMPKSILGFTAVADSSLIRLSWLVAEEADTLGYHIYRRAKGEDHFTLLATVSDRFTLQYIDGRIDKQTLYYYYIVGVNPLQQEGDPSSLVAASLVPDTEEPVITSLTPADGSSLKGNVTFTLQAEDNYAVTGSSLEYAVGEQPAETDWTLLHESGGALCTAELDTTTLPDGPLQLRALAWDGAGNQSGTLIAHYTIQNSGPAAVTGLSGESTATTITLRWNEPTEDVAVFRVEQKQPDGSFSAVEHVRGVLGVNLYDLTPDTDYTFRVVSGDSLGNFGAPSEEITVHTQADTEPPVITRLRPTPASYADEIPFQVTVTDAWDVQSITVQVSTDNLDWTDIFTQTYDTPAKTRNLSCPLSLGEYEEGLLWVRAVASDSAGNTSSTGEDAPYVQYYVDRTAPAAPQSVMAAGEGGSIRISWEQGTEDDLGTYSVYRSEDADGEFVLVQDGLQTVDWLDRTVQADQKYYYQVIVNDTAGNASEPSATVSATAEKDTVAPTVVSFAPASGSPVGPAETSASLMVQDNRAVASVELEYSRDGQNYQTLKTWQDLNESSRVLSFNRPAEEFSGGDTMYLRARATDAAGNTGEWVTVQYPVDTTAPALTDGTAAYENNAVELQWNGGAEQDLAAYCIYRSEDGGESYRLLGQTVPGETRYTDTSLALQEIAYTYQVEAVDGAGNTARLDLGTVQLPNRSAPVPELSCDTVMEVGVEYVFDATLSKDDKGIAGYQLDFGDDTTASEAVAVHAYHRTGDFTVTLTVTNTDGLVSTLSRQIHVKERNLIGHAKVQVLDESGAPVIGAAVYFDLGEEDQAIRLTDAQGNVEFDGTVGMHTVACLIADNQWLPAKKEVELLAGQETSLSITMVKQTLVEGNFEINRMTYEEIVAAGIDVTKPENQCILRVTVHLTYGGSNIDHTFNYNPTTQEVSGNPIVVRSDGETHELIVQPLCSGSLSVKDDEEEPEPGSPDYIFSHEVSIAYLDIPVGASALKDMFDVRLHILNNASSDFPLLNNAVELHLPEGLTLMDAYDSEPEANVSIGEIPGQSAETIRWIVRGDEPGKYDLSADYSGVLGGFNAPIQAHFAASEPLEVYGLSGMEMTIQIPTELDNGSFYYNVILANTSAVDLYRPRIGTESRLIQALVYNNMGEDVTDSMQWLVDETDSDFALVPDVSENIQVLPAGYRLVHRYVEIDQTDYSTMEQKLSDYALKIETGYGMQVHIEQLPLSDFTGALSATVDSLGKAEQTLTTNQDALSYLMDNGQYVYWSLFKSSGEIADMMPTQTERDMWTLLGVVTGENKFTELLEDDPDAVRNILLRAMELSVESNESAQYTFVSQFFGSLNDWINSDLGGNKGMLAISNVLEKKASGWTDSAISDASKVMKETLQDTISSIFKNKRWEAFQSIFQAGSNSVNKVIWDEFKTALQGKDSDLAQKLKELNLSEKDSWEILYDLLSDEGMDEAWKKLGFENSVKDLFLNEVEKNPEDVALYLAARSSMNSYILYLDAIIEYGREDSRGARALVNSAKEIRTILLNEGDANPDFWSQLIKTAKQTIFGGIDKGVKSFVSSKICKAILAGFKAFKFVSDNLLNTREQHEIANNIFYIGCMSEAIHRGLQVRQAAYEGQGTEESASNYMQMIHYLLNLREIGEEQVAALGIAMEIAPGVLDSKEFLQAANQISGLTSAISWLKWRDAVEDRITLLRVQLLRSPLQQDSTALTAPEVTFDYSKGQTVQSFSDRYEYSLNNGADWTRCAGTPIAVAQSFGRTELLVRAVDADAANESLTARLSIYPPAALSDLRVFQTENGYRVEGLDRSRTYQVTFSQTPISYSYGDALELNVPEGSSTFAYQTAENFAYVYVRAVTDDLHYASFVAAPPIYPMVDISVDTMGSGTVSGSGRYEYGTTVTLYPSTASGVYEFAGWYEDGYLISNQPTLTLQAQENRLIVARFEKIITDWEAVEQTRRAIGIEAGTPVQEVVDYFSDTEHGISARLTDANGQETNTLATGDILYLNETPYYVVAMGDVDGDGDTDQTDLDAMVNYLNCTKELEGVYLEAGLFCRNEDMDLFDVYQALEYMKKGAAS